MSKFALSIAACILGNLLLRAAAAAALGTIALFLGFHNRSGSEVPATFLGVLALAFYGAEFLGAPVFGAMADVRGRKPFLLLGGFLGAGAMLPITLIPALPIFVVSKVLTGLSSASSIPAVLSYLAAMTSERPALRGRVMAVFEVATIAGITLGFALGGFLWDRLQVGAFVVIMVIFLVASCVFMLVQGEGLEGRQHRGWQTYQSLLRHRAILGFMPSWLAVNAVLGIWFTHLSFQMAQAVNPDQFLVGGYSGTVVGLVIAGMGATVVVGTAGWMPLFGWLRSTTIMGIASVGLCAFCVFIYLLNHSPRGGDGSLLMAFSFLGIVVTILVSSGFTPAALAHLAEISEQFPSERGSMMGFYSVLLGIGQLSGGWIGGFFAEAWAVDGLILLSFILSFLAGSGILLTKAAGEPIPLPSYRDHPS